MAAREETSLGHKLKRPLQRKDQIRYRATRNTMIATDRWILKPQLLLMDFYPARHAET